MVAQGLIFTCSSMFQGLGNTKPVLLTSATRVFTYSLPAIWLSTRPGFRMEYVWYLSIAATTLQAALSLWLLRREFRKRLALPPKEKARGAGKPRAGRASRCASPRSDATLVSIPTAPASLPRRGWAANLEGTAMTEVLNEQGRASWLSAIWAARYRTPARFVALVALLLPWSDHRRDFCARALADRLCFHRPSRTPALAAAPDLPAADRAVRAGTRRHALVGCALGRAAARARAAGKTAGDPAADLPVRALALRQMGFCGVPGLLHAAHAVLLHCRDRSRGSR